MDSINTVAGWRKLALTVFSYTYLVYLVFVPIIVIACGGIRIKFGVKVPIVYRK